MADTKISAMVLASDLSAAVLPIVQGGVNKRIQSSALAIGGAANAVVYTGNNVLTSDVTNFSYNPSTHVLNVTGDIQLNGVSVTTLAAGWKLTGTTNLTNGSGPPTITGPVRTAASNSDFVTLFNSGTLTGRAAQAADILFGYRFEPVLATGTNGQTLVGVSIALIGSGTGTFYSLLVNGDQKSVGDIIAGQTGANASSTGTQGGSFSTHFNTTLWTGAAPALGWLSWRANASTTTNQQHDLTLYSLRSGSTSQTYANPLFRITDAPTVSYADMIGPGARIRTQSTNNQPSYFQMLDSSGVGRGAFFTTFSTGEVAHYANTSYFSTIWANNAQVLRVDQFSANPILDNSVGWGVPTLRWSIVYARKAMIGTNVAQSDGYSLFQVNGAASIDNTGTASSTATQVGSSDFNFKSGLWTGAAATTGWFSWRSDASTASNSLYGLNLYQSTGTTPAFTNQIFGINSNAEFQFGTLSGSQTVKLMRSTNAGGTGSSSGTNFWFMSDMVMNLDGDSHFGFARNATTFAPTVAGTISMVRAGVQFAPTSGSTTFVVYRANPTWNQTSTASGDVVGFLYDPTVTAVLGKNYALKLHSGVLLLGHTTNATSTSARVYVRTTGASGNFGLYVENTTPARLFAINEDGSGIFIGAGGQSTTLINSTSTTVTWAGGPNARSLGFKGVYTNGSNYNAAVIIGYSAGVTDSTGSLFGVNLNLNTIWGPTGVGGQVADLHINSTFNPASGSTTHAAIQINQVLNLTGTATGVQYGIDYNPTVTALNSVAHLAFRATSGSVLIGGTTLTASTILDLQSTTLALRVPNVTAIASVATPAKGMIVYDATTDLFNFYQGSTPGWVTLSGTALSIQTCDVTLNQTQILSLNTSPVTLVAAPGANKFIYIVSPPIVKYVFNTAAFATNLNLVLTHGANTTTNVLGAVINQVADQVANFGMVQWTGAATGIINQAVKAQIQTGNPTGGGASSTLRIYFQYIILTL